MPLFGQLFPHALKLLCRIANARLSYLGQLRSVVVLLKLGVARRDEANMARACIKRRGNALKIIIDKECVSGGDDLFMLKLRACETIAARVGPLSVKSRHRGNQRVFGDVTADHAHGQPSVTTSNFATHNAQNTCLSALSYS